MSNRLALRRRSFLGHVAATGGGLALGWELPAGCRARAGGGQAVGIWVVISPDDTTVVRIARSEMGQGTFTGLAQLVADELDCDWKHVRAEYVSPDDNLANKRAWGDMSTGGSRGIRGSVRLCAQRRRGRSRHVDRGGGAALERAARPNAPRRTARSPTRRAAARCAMARSRPMRRSCRCRPR